MMAFPLSIDEQVAAMKADWPKFACRNVDRTAGSVRWVGEITPQYATFTIEIRYRFGDFPDVRVLDPVLTRLPGNAEGQLPHVYPPADDPTLCLFDPGADQWNGSMPISQTIVPWAMDWIACYELWLMTGTWTGGGRHPGEQIVTSILENTR